MTERTISKDLRRVGSRAMVRGRDIYVAKHRSTLETYDTVGPLERVGSIDAVSYTQGAVTINTLRVLLYSHAYPREFPVSEMSAAQDYALSLLS